MKKKLFVLLMALLMVMTMMPTTAFAANGTGHQISVKIYKVVLDSSKPLGYQTPELITTKTVTCQDSTGHSGYNHFVNLKEFHPTAVNAPTTDWTGWEFDLYYTKGKEQGTFYNWTKDRVNATANVTGSEPYPCSKNFYLVYKDSNPTPLPQPTTPEKPTDDTVRELLKNAVTVHCINADANHADVTYDLLDKSFTVGEVQENAEARYTVAVTIQAEKYVAKYNENLTEHNTLDGEESKIITLTYNSKTKSWGTPSPASVTFNVKCETVNPPSDKPTAPSNEDVKALLGDAVVKVHCTNTNANVNVNHADETYDLLDGSFNVGEVQGSEEDGYTVAVTIQAAKYVKNIM